MKISAILGPTNTGKTYYAVERMLKYKNGIIGFPLRLLARENYEKVLARIGAEQVGLITGEEKIIPKTAKFFFCTVEAMPKNKIGSCWLPKPWFIINKKGANTVAIYTNVLLFT